MKNYVYGLILLFSTQLMTQSSVFAADKNTILVFGDSLSAAYNMKPEDGWVSLLREHLIEEDISYRVVNASISGETTGGGLARFKDQLESSSPDIVILELGANDGLRGFKLNIPKKNLKEMIQLSLTSGAKVLLAGIRIPPNYGRTYTQRFHQIYQDLAKSENIQLIPFIMEGIATKPRLMQLDRIHPNPAGQKVMFENVLPHLLPML